MLLLHPRRHRTQLVGGYDYKPRTAVEGDELTQSFESESHLAEGAFTFWE